MATCNVDVHLSDIMTPQSFSNLIATLIKYLIYEKQLIPYPYDRMKLYLEKYKNVSIKENNSCIKNNKYKLESDNYYKKVSEAINTLETVFQCIENEFIGCVKNHIESVVILIGSNILNPLTVFNINVPELNYTHSEKHDFSRQHIDSVFKKILNNDKFNDILTSNILIEANLYLMFKVKEGQKIINDWCVPKEHFHTFRGKQVILKFDQPVNVMNNQKYESYCVHDCLDFNIFVDLDKETNDQPTYNNKMKNKVDWYLGKYFISGFKNYKFNGIPISDIWLNPQIIDKMVL